MQKKRYDVTCPVEYEDRDRQQRTQWLRCGTGFENRDGSINVILETLPLNGKLMIAPHRPRDDRHNDRRDDRGDRR